MSNKKPKYDPNETLVFGKAKKPDIPDESEHSKVLQAWMEEELMSRDEIIVGMHRILKDYGEIFHGYEDAKHKKVSGIIEDTEGNTKYRNDMSEREKRLKWLVAVVGPVVTVIATLLIQYLFSKIN